jgi:DNA-binding helix-hairpin-helix protein with protein kinase domain
VIGMHSVIDFYNPKSRRQVCPLFNYRYLHRAARNLAAVVRALHARGYVIGDVNESNILVSETALIALVDTDSFQVHDPQNGSVYRCPVGKPEFTPAELQGKTFASIDRKPEHDLFGLAVLIFQLLMEGTHPFAGIFEGSDDPPLYEERIAAGHFPYGKQRVPYRFMSMAPPFETLHPTLRHLIVRCFEDGHDNPQARPEAQIWQSALDEAESALVTCAINIQHLYGNRLNACPWCERMARLGGRDPFPSQQAVRQGPHQQPVAPPRRTSRPPRPQIQPTQPTQRTVTPQPPTTSHWRKKWTLAALAFALLVLGMVVWHLVPSKELFTKALPSAETRPQTKAASKTTEKGPSRERDGAPMVLVPAGEFLMGSEDGRRDQKPAHRVYLDAFYIDTYEVTNALYQKFMQATGRQAPRYWNDVKH